MADQTIDQQAGQTTARPIRRTFNREWLPKAAVIMGLDILAVGASYLMALLLRFDFLATQVPQEYVDGFRTLALPSIIAVVATFWTLRLYHSIWSFASMPELMRLMVAWTVDAALLPLMAYALGVHMPVSYWLVGSFFGFASTTGIPLLVAPPASGAQYAQERGKARVSGRCR